MSKRKVTKSTIRITEKSNPERKKPVNSFASFGAGAFTGAAVHSIFSKNKNTDAVSSKLYKEQIDTQSMLDDVKDASTRAMKNKVERCSRDIDNSVSEYNRAINLAKESIISKTNEYENYIERKQDEVKDIKSDLIDLQDRYREDLELAIKDSLLKLTIPDQGEVLSNGNTKKMMAYRELLNERIREAQLQKDIQSKKYENERDTKRMELDAESVRQSRNHRHETTIVLIKSVFWISTILILFGGAVNIGCSNKTTD